MIDDFTWEHTFTAKMPMRYRLWSWIRKHTLCCFGHHRVMVTGTLTYADWKYVQYSYCLDCDYVSEPIISDNESTSGIYICASDEDDVVFKDCKFHSNGKREVKDV